MLRSRILPLAVLALCGATAPWCISLARRASAANRVRQTHERAIELYKDSQFEEALPLLDASLAHTPDRADLYRIAAYICARLGKIEDYRRYAAELLARTPGAEAARIHFHLGLLDLNGTPDGTRSLDGAIGHFEAALKEDEGLLDARAALGIALALKGDPARARPYLERVWIESTTRDQGRFTPSARLWQIADLLRRGEVLDAWRDFEELAAAGAALPKGDYATPIALALALRANAPGSSSVIRRLCLGATARLPEKVREQSAVALHTLAAAAYERLGEDYSALSEYQLAYDRDAAKSETTRRNLAHALRLAAARAEDKTKAAELEAKSVQVYRELLAEGRLAPDEQRRLALALATRAWNEGRTDDALKTLQAAGDAAALTALRMRAALAIEGRKYREALALLQDALKLDGSQEDVAALLKRLATPPEVRNFRVNALGRYDPRPILSAVVLPRALPIPIEPKNITMKLDGQVVQPIYTTAECFYRPPKELGPGEHKVEIAATDAVGLTTSKTLTFTLELDKDPPKVLGLAPADKSTTDTLDPVIGFRCTDPSGISDSSLSVTFSGRVGKPPQYREGLTVVDKGAFLIDLGRSGIKKGTLIRGGTVAFRFSDPLGEGNCSVRVAVSDIRGNRTVKSWTFKATAPPPEKAPRKP